MHNKIVARINFPVNSPVVLFMFILPSIVVLFFLGLEIFSLQWFFILFVFLSLLFAIFFYNKIELDNDILMIKSILFVRSWIWYPIIPELIVNKAISINSITSINFANRNGIIIGAGGFFGPGDLVTLYYLLPSGKKANLTVPVFFYPEFVNIIDEIIKRKPDLKVKSTNITFI
jgi:hypothetical protein